MTTTPATTSSRDPEPHSGPDRTAPVVAVPYHRMVTALGVAWILDGLETTIASNVGPDLTLKGTLHMSASAVADIATWYLIGEVIGALFFGQLSDKVSHKNVFMVTSAACSTR
jgi:MFS family permease